MLGYEGYRNFGALARDPEQPLWAVVRQRIMNGGKLSEQGYRELLERRRQAAIHFANALEGFDALLMPACDQAAQPLDAADVVHVGLGKLMRSANFLGAAAIALPAGFDDEGMPIGVQALAPALRDKQLLDSAADMAPFIREAARTPDLSRWGL